MNKHQALRHLRSILTACQDMHSTVGVRSLKDDVQEFAAELNDAYFLNTAELKAEHLNKYVAIVYRAAIAGRITKEMVNVFLTDNGTTLGAQKIIFNRELAVAAQRLYELSSQGSASSDPLATQKQEAKVLATKRSELLEYTDFSKRFAPPQLPIYVEWHEASYQHIIRQCRSMIAFLELGTDLKRAALRLKADLQRVLFPSRHMVDAAQLNQYLATAYRAALAGCITHDMLQGLLKNEDGLPLWVDDNAAFAAEARAVQRAYLQWHQAAQAAAKQAPVSHLKQQAQSMAMSSSNSANYQTMIDLFRPPVEGDTRAASWQSPSQSEMAASLTSFNDLIPDARHSDKK